MHRFSIFFSIRPELKTITSTLKSATLVPFIVYYFRSEQVHTGAAGPKQVGVNSCNILHLKLMDWTNRSHPGPMRYHPQRIETCIVQCSRQCSNKTSLRNVIAQKLRFKSWPEDLDGSFQKSLLVAAKLLVETIDSVGVCPCSLCDGTLRSNV